MLFHFHVFTFSGQVAGEGGIAGPQGGVQAPRRVAEMSPVWPAPSYSPAQRRQQLAVPPGVSQEEEPPVTLRNPQAPD